MRDIQILRLPNLLVTQHTHTHRQTETENYRFYLYACELKSRELCKAAGGSKGREGAQGGGGHTLTWDVSVSSVFPSAAFVCCVPLIQFV